MPVKRVSEQWFFLSWRSKSRILLSTETLCWQIALMYVQLYIHEREGASKASTHLEPSTRRRWVVRTTLRPPYSRTNTVPLYRRLAGPRGRSGRHGTSHQTGIWSPARLERSESLYRLSYPGRHLDYESCNKWANRRHTFGDGKGK